jgi:3-deoxy-D-manno-octulosonic-acid transferase
MMSRFFYYIALYLWLPITYLKIWRKGRQSPEYRKRWGERLGFFTINEKHQNGICFHCVSVGETLAAIPLIKKVQQQYPQLPITVTTMTPTGSEQVRLAFADSVFHVYLPFDTPGAVKRFLTKVRPKLLVIIETELWPNLLHFSRLNNTKILVANARLSEKSAAGYHKYNRITYKMMLDISHVSAQTEQDGQRYCELGLDNKKLSVSGSIKFDIQLEQALKQKSQLLKQQWAPHRPVWVAGSIHIDELNDIFLAFEKILTVVPDLLLVVVPRHPEYFQSISEQIKKSPFSMIKRSDNCTPDNSVQIVLGDTMGELLLFWGIADIAFVGGSLIESGGHNPLEPAVFSLPIVTGPHVYNFTLIYELLKRNEGVLFAADSEQLATHMLSLLQDPLYRQTVGENAGLVVKENRGPLNKLFKEVEKLLD